MVTGDGLFRAAFPQEASSPVTTKVQRDTQNAQFFDGRGVEKACAVVKEDILNNLIGMSVQDQEQIDSLLAELDGTPDFSGLGANVCWPVSAGCCLAGAAN